MRLMQSILHLLCCMVLLLIVVLHQWCCCLVLPSLGMPLFGIAITWCCCCLVLPLLGIAIAWFFSCLVLPLLGMPSLDIAIAWYCHCLTLVAWFCHCFHHLALLLLNVNVALVALTPWCCCYWCCYCHCHLYHCHATSSVANLSSIEQISLTSSLPNVPYMVWYIVPESVGPTHSLYLLWFFITMILYPVLYNFLQCRTFCPAKC